MADRYEHEIIDSSGTKHPFSLTVEAGEKGVLVWPRETSKLETIRRVAETRVSALIVWPTMKIRCWIGAAGSGNGTDLEIQFAMTPYRYRIEDGGAFVKFLAALKLPKDADEAEGGEPAAHPDGAFDDGNGIDASSSSGGE